MGVAQIKFYINTVLAMFDFLKWSINLIKVPYLSVWNILLLLYGLIGENNERNKIKIF